MPRFVLGKMAVRRIHAAIEHLFARAKTRLLGRRHEPKVISFGYSPPQHREDLSLPGIFDFSAQSEGMSPNEALRESLSRVAEQYLTAHQERAKAQVVHAVQSFIHEAEAKGKEVDFKTVLGGELAQLMGRVTTDVKRLVDTEGTRARNVGSVDAITKVNAMLGVEDPVVAFLGPNDNHTCSECLRLYFWTDGVTPRVWKLSEVGHAYHKHGDPDPKVGGLHPHCRHTLVSVTRGHGFVGGKLTFISPDHDELARQRG